jgi:hypothetical protein
MRAGPACNLLMCLQKKAFACKKKDLPTIFLASGNFFAATFTVSMDSQGEDAGAEIKASHESHGSESHRDLKSVLRQKGCKTIKSKELMKKVSWSLGVNSEGINANG